MVGKISKHFFSWEQIHATVLQSVEQLQNEFEPTLLVGISGGGLVPARMLRSGFKIKTGRTLPIQVVGALHYDDDAGCVHEAVVRTQWLAPDVNLSGARVLLIDEVDDSRKTLSFIVAEMLKYFDEVEASQQAPGSPDWARPQLGVYVIHNKVRPKEAEIHPSVYPSRYYVGGHQPNTWHVYPWEAEDIAAHTAIAVAQEHYFRERPGELAKAMEAAKQLLDPKAAASAPVHYADGGSTAAPPLQDQRQYRFSFTMQQAPDVSFSKPVSALTSALTTNGTDSQKATVAAADDSRPAPPEAAPAWRSSDPDSIYCNLGYVPDGLAPRIGSVTLVDLANAPPPVKQ